MEVEGKENSVILKALLLRELCRVEIHDTDISNTNRVT